MAAKSDPPDEAGPSRAARKVIYPALVLALAVLAFYLATRTPESDPLPGVALGSEALLVAERTASFFAILFLGALVLVRALQGELPEELSGRGVKYARSDSVDELRDRVDAQFEAYDKSLEELEAGQGQLDERVSALESREERPDSG